MKPENIAKAVDLYNEQKKATGTKIIIHLPVL